MGTVEVYTKDRMQAIEAASVVDGNIDTNGHLLLQTYGGTVIDAGNVKGDPGTPAPVTTFIRDPTNASFTPSSFSVGLTVGTAGTDMPYTFATVETIYMNINRGVQRVTDKETGRVIWRTSISGVWSEWHFLQDRGTTAERDFLYPAPTTDAEKAALANRKVRWYNTELGWEESYYAPTGLTGLTAQGLIAGTPEGWYPIGEGPYITLEPTTAFQASAGNYVMNWHNGNLKRKGGSAWFTPGSNGFVQVHKPGRYDISVWTLLANGAGTANFHLRVLNSALSTVEKQVDGVAFTLTSSLSVRMHVEYPDAHISAGKQVGLFCHSGDLQVHFLNYDPRAQFVVRYKGPLLAAD